MEKPTASIAGLEKDVNLYIVPSSIQSTKYLEGLSLSLFAKSLTTIQVLEPTWDIQIITTFRTPFEDQESYSNCNCMTRGLRIAINADLSISLPFLLELVF